MDPIFSVVVPTFERPDLLERALRSLLAQTLTDFEVIVVDDYSASPAESVTRRLGDPRIKVVRNAMNLGAAKSRNVGVEMCRGSYIAFLDDDDEYEAELLATALRRMETGGESVGWTDARYVEYAENGDITGVVVRSYSASYATHAEALEAFLSIGIGSGVIIRSACLAHVGAFDSDLYLVEDTDLFLRVIARDYVPVAVVGTHVVIHNHHRVRLTAKANHQHRIRESRLLLRRHEQVFSKFPSLRAQLSNHIARLEQAMLIEGHAD